MVDGKPVSFRHPADAIRIGMVFVAADRAEALLMQRSVRENISLPFSARITQWGWINLRREQKKVDEAVETLQIDARAGSEVRRLSGGNQQKVTIARWVASGVKTMLCFDPTRGIDIRTKTQIYVLLRDLAAAGAAILLYTSELKEIQLACDRVIVIFGGQVVAEMPAAGADEAALLRAAHNLKPGAELPEEVVAATSAEKAAVEAAVDTVSATMSAPAATIGRPRSRAADTIDTWTRNNAWTLGLLVFLLTLLAFTKFVNPNYSLGSLANTATSVVPLALAAVAQAVVVISGGIDLSISSQMALTSCVAATLMSNYPGDGTAVGDRHRRAPARAWCWGRSTARSSC